MAISPPAIRLRLPWPAHIQRAGSRRAAHLSIRVREPAFPRRGAAEAGGADAAKRRRLLEPKNLLQSHSGRGVQGRAGATSTSALRQRMFATAQGQKDGAPVNRDLAEMHMDPRELLLRYADKPNVFTAAYDETQPVTILSKDDAADGEADEG